MRSWVRLAAFFAALALLSLALGGSSASAQELPAAGGVGARQEARDSRPVISLRGEVARKAVGGREVLVLQAPGLFGFGTQEWVLVDVGDAEVPSGARVEVAGRRVGTLGHLPVLAVSKVAVVRQPAATGPGQQAEVAQVRPVPGVPFAPVTLDGSESETQGRVVLAGRVVGHQDGYLVLETAGGGHAAADRVAAVRPARWLLKPHEGPAQELERALKEQALVEVGGRYVGELGGVPVLEVLGARLVVAGDAPVQSGGPQPVAPEVGPAPEVEARSVSEVRAALARELEQLQASMAALEQAVEAAPPAFRPLLQGVLAVERAAYQRTQWILVLLERVGERRAPGTVER